MRLYLESIDDVFPARAGMSHSRPLGRTTKVSFPRTRGDEPAIRAQLARVDQFSPHARG